MFAVWKDCKSCSKGESFHMSSSTRSANHNRILTICIIALLLAVALPAAVAAQLPPPPPPSDNLDDGELPPPPPPPSPGNTGTTSPTPTPTPTPERQRWHPAAPAPTKWQRWQQTPASGRPDPYAVRTLHRFSSLIASSSTPQPQPSSCRVEDGLQYYFIGRDGSTRISAPGSRPSPS